ALDENGRGGRARSRDRLHPDRFVRHQANHRDQGLGGVVVLVLILGIGLIAVATTLIIRSLALPSTRSAERVEAMPSYGFEGTSTLLDAGEADGEAGPIDRLATSVGEFVGRRLSLVQEAELRRRLVAAGLYSTSPRKFVGYQVLCSTAMTVLAVWIISVG